MRVVWACACVHIYVFGARMCVCIYLSSVYLVHRCMKVYINPLLCEPLHLCSSDEVQNIEHHLCVYVWVCVQVCVCVCGLCVLCVGG